MIDIIQIHYPGWILDYDIYLEDYAKINSAIPTLQNCLDEMHLSLSLYIPAKEKRAAIQQEKRNIAFNRTNKSTTGEFTSFDLNYSDTAVFMHAHSFLYAVDMYLKIMKTLKPVKSIQRDVQRSIDNISRSFPGLQEVRNSAQHLEDRLNQTNKSKKDITPQPFTIDQLAIDSGFMTRSFINDKLTYTSADGKSDYVDIIDKSLQTVAADFQDFISSLKWKGDPVAKPEFI